MDKGMRLYHFVTYFLKVMVKQSIHDRVATHRRHGSKMTQGVCEQHQVVGGGGVGLNME